MVVLARTVYGPGEPVKDCVRGYCSVEEAKGVCLQEDIQSAETDLA
jgi:hypothetical protein